MTRESPGTQAGHPSPMMQAILFVAIGTMLAIASDVARAQASTNQSGQGTSGSTTPAASASSTAAPEDELIDAEVRRVDRSAGKITLAHGEIRHAKMPAMTMVFEVRDPALIARIEPGDKIRFSVRRQGGAWIVTAIEPRP